MLIGIQSLCFVSTLNKSQFSLLYYLELTATLDSRMLSNTLILLHHPLRDAFFWQSYDRYMDGI